MRHARRNCVHDPQTLAGFCCGFCGVAGDARSDHPHCHRIFRIAWPPGQGCLDCRGGAGRLNGAGGFAAGAGGGAANIGVLVLGGQVRGGLYLLYLGIKLLRAGGADAKTHVPETPDSRWRLFVNTYLVTALNPKGIVFFVAFLPQFIHPGANAAQQLLVLACTFVAMAIINSTLYAYFAASARTLLASPGAQRRFTVASGSLLSIAGIWVLLARRPA